MSIKENYQRISGGVARAAAAAGRNASGIRIIAVSKTKPVEDIREAYDCGIRVFGENYVQELREKHPQLSAMKDIEWHFIGHLQTNKVKYIVPFVSFIHSVDSVRLAEEIDRQAGKNSRRISVLIQVNTSGEESKFGCNPAELETLAEEVLRMENIDLCGLMSIAGMYGEQEKAAAEFAMLRKLKQGLEQKHGMILPELSMGMTGDFPEAVREGATMIRIGTAIFGQRNYK